MSLTAHQVATAPTRQKLYALYDGQGLCLHVTPRGSKLWRFRYLHCGREKMISLGRYPKVSLQRARRKHAEARGLVSRGIDPSLERRQQRAIDERTFESVARSWLRLMDVQVKKKLLTQDTVTDARRLLERHIFPQLGKRPIGSIGPRDLLTVLKEIELKGLLHTARRTKQRCSRVFRHAIGLGYLSRDITEDLRGFLEAPKVRHRPAITDPRRLGKLLTAADGYEGRRITAFALKLAPMLFVRPGELRKARWMDIDFKDAVWRIPADCMKSRVQHLVPLPRQALRLLRELQTLTGVRIPREREHVFHGMVNTDSTAT